MKTSERAMFAIEGFEHFMPSPYLCPTGHWTLGFGHVIERPDEYPFPITLTQGRTLLAQDLAIAEDAVARRVEVPLTQGQFDALVSWVFNLGEQRLAHGGPNGGPSTLLLKLNVGDYSGAAREFRLWVYGENPKTHKKEVLPGLVARRAIETEWFKEELK